MNHHAALFIFPLFTSFAKCFLTIISANARFFDVCKNKKMSKKISQARIADAPVYISFRLAISGSFLN